MLRPRSGPRTNRVVLTLVATCSLLLGWLVVASQVTSAAPAAEPSLRARVLPVKLWHQQPGPGRSQSLVDVKFVDGSGLRVRGGRLVAAASSYAAASLREVLAGYPRLRATPLFGGDNARLAALQHRREVRSGRELADLTQFFRLHVPPGTDVTAFTDALNALPIVESAQLAPTPVRPPTTPNFVPLQGYRSAAASGGIDANYAATLPGGTGSNVRLVDVEYSWNRHHEDLAALRATGSAIQVGTPFDPFHDNNHGTAVVGEIAGTANGFGITGLAPDVALGTVNVDSREFGFNVARAVLKASQRLSAGDVMLIEQQITGPVGDCGADQTGCVPVEWDTAAYNAIASATAAGIIVVEAAGNGYENLDAPVYGTRFPMGQADSGAIMVGAGNGPGCTAYGTFAARGKLPFSNYGSRVDLQGWGDCIYTTGYGDLQAVPNATYTANFAGTSGASPMVASAAADLSSVAEEGGRTLTPAQVRALLVSTGTPQAPADVTHIGPLPNLKAAIAALTSSTPVVARPQHTVRRGAKVSATVPVREFWSAQDPSGIVEYAVAEQIDGGSWSALDLPSPTSTSVDLALAPGHSYRYRVRARNGHGDWSPYAYEPAYRPTVVQENAGVQYSTGWTRTAVGSASGGHLEVSRTRDTWARLGFHGSCVAWIAATGPERGKAFVYLDGYYVETVDLRSAGPVARKVVRTYHWPRGGNHKIKVVVAGTAGRPAVDVDAFAVT